MNDPVDRLLDERQAMDRGWPGGLIVSLFAHLMLVGGAFAVVDKLKNAGVDQIGFAYSLPEEKARR